MEQRQNKKKVLVIGGGFGGVFAAKALEKPGRGRLDVELINRNNYFVFQPLLPEVAASTIHSADAVVPLRQLLRGVQVRLIVSPSPEFALEQAGLAAAGVDIRLADSLYIHAKAIIADGERAFVGSQNLSATSLDQNRELGIIVDDPRSRRSTLATGDAGPV